MEQVIRTYGTFLLEAAVLTVLCWLLFRGISDDAGNHGVFAMAGTYQKEELPAARLDFTRYQSEGEKSAPVIQYVWTGMLHVGEYSLDELLRAEDYLGQALQPRLCGVLSPRGMEQTAEEMADDGRIRFDEQGIYTLKVHAIDAWNRVTECEFRIPVNGGVD